MVQILVGGARGRCSTGLPGRASGLLDLDQRPLPCWRDWRQCARSRL